MKTWWSVALGVVFGLLAAGVVYLASTPPRGEAIALYPPPTPIPLKVHISGAVINPGVYTLPREARLQDAIQAAGGFSEGADEEALNLAARLQDGDRVHVPLKNRALENPSASPAGEPDGGEGQLPTPISENLVNINTASQEELESLPRIGPVTARKIIDYRETNGDFARVEDIQKVSGIGPVTYGEIKDLITVDVNP